MTRQFGRAVCVLAFSMLAIGLTAGAASAADPAPSSADPGVIVITDPSPKDPGPRAR